MAEFDFAPRPPKQTEQSEERSPFGSADSTAANQADKAGLSPGRPGAAAQGKSAGGRSPARNPAETQSMIAGLVSMATTMGMARFTNPHVDPISSPTGLLGLVKSAFGAAKHEAADDHKFNLDLSRHGVAGGGIGGMTTGLGMIGGPVQSMAKRESTGAAMRAIGSLARSMGGGLGAVMGEVGNQARHHMHWLDHGVKTLYKVER